MAKLYKIGEGILVFHCPGCGYGHPFHIKASEHSTGQSWQWNGSMDASTFMPSLMINRDYPAQRCHSFVKDGKIQFLADCFHKLAGQTVDLPECD